MDYRRPGTQNFVLLNLCIMFRINLRLMWSYVGNQRTTKHITDQTHENPLLSFCRKASQNGNVHDCDFTRR